MSKKIVYREEYRRGVFGWVTRLSLWAFNIFMTYWLFRYWAHASTDIAHMPSRDAAGIALIIGTATVMAQWLAGGLVLYLLMAITRGPRYFIAETE